MDYSWSSFHQGPEDGFSDAPTAAHAAQSSLKTEPETPRPDVAHQFADELYGLVDTTGGATHPMTYEDLQQMLLEPTSDTDHQAQLRPDDTEAACSDGWGSSVSDHWREGYERGLIDARRQLESSLKWLGTAPVDHWSALHQANRISWPPNMPPMPFNGLDGHNTSPWPDLPPFIPSVQMFTSANSEEVPCSREGWGFGGTFEDQIRGRPPAPLGHSGYSEAGHGDSPAPAWYNAEPPLMWEDACQDSIYASHGLPDTFAACGEEKAVFVGRSLPAEASPEVAYPVDGGDLSRNIDSSSNLWTADTCAEEASGRFVKPEPGLGQTPGPERWQDEPSTPNEIDDGQKGLLEGSVVDKEGKEAENKVMPLPAHTLRGTQQKDDEGGKSRGTKSHDLQSRRERRRQPIFHEETRTWYKVACARCRKYKGNSGKCKNERCTWTDSGVCDLSIRCEKCIQRGITCEKEPTIRHYSAHDKVEVPPGQGPIYMEDGRWMNRSCGPCAQGSHTRRCEWGITGGDLSRTCTGCVHRGLSAEE